MSKTAAKQGETAGQRWPLTLTLTVTLTLNLTLIQGENQVLNGYVKDRPLYTLTLTLTLTLNGYVKDRPLYTRWKPDL